MSRDPIPYHVRVIAEDVALSDFIFLREENFGHNFMIKECERLNKFVSDNIKFSYWSYRKSDRIIEFYLTVETPNEEGSWV